MQVGGQLKLWTAGSDPPAIDRAAFITIRTEISGKLSQTAQHGCTSLGGIRTDNTLILLKMAMTKTLGAIVAERDWNAEGGYAR